MRRGKPFLTSHSAARPSARVFSRQRVFPPPRSFPTQSNTPNPKPLPLCFRKAYILKLPLHPATKRYKFAITPPRHPVHPPSPALSRDRRERDFPPCLCPFVPSSHVQRSSFSVQR